MLLKCKKQREERHEKHAAANAKHPRGHSANTSDGKDPRSAAYGLRQGLSPVRCPRQPSASRVAAFSKAGMPPASGNNQMLLLSAVKASEARPSFLHKRPITSPARIEFQPASPPGPASS